MICCQNFLVRSLYIQNYRLAVPLEVRASLPNENQTFHAPTTAVLTSATTENTFNSNKQQHQHHEPITPVKNNSNNIITIIETVPQNSSFNLIVSSKFLFTSEKSFCSS